MVIGDMITTGRILFVESWGFRWLTLATAASTILAIVAGTGAGGTGGGNSGGGNQGQAQPSFATQPGPAAGGGQPYSFGQASAPGAPAPLNLQNPTYSGGTVISGPPPEKKPAPAEGMSFGELGKGHN
ncbi:MAG TPA: hypothetical protein VM689_09355 [Aliidongia sp.]|nr:hypothetical protein [Aliidongia sp.]